MIETGRFSKAVWLLFYLSVVGLFSVTELFAQDFSVEATVSENRIFIGEQFTISVEVKGTSMRDVSLPVLPRIDGVGTLSSTPSRSTSISIVNGRTTTSTSYSFSLIAREKGSYTIPPITIEIDGETHSTNSLQIEVIERGNLSRADGRQMPEIFLEVEVDDNNPVPGQQIVASLVLYFKQGVEITSFQPSAGWRTDGFWKEELQNIRQPEAESVILGGVRYRKATLIRYALFPSRSGNLSLSEFPLNVGIRTQPNRNDPFGSFFGSGTNQRRVSLESTPVEITVRPLPPAENAISMNAVGDLRITRNLNLDEVVTGETVELRTKIEGTGNIPLVRKPNYEIPDGLDLYTPQENSDIERRGLNIRGEKTFTELMVARAPGIYEIPSERVAVYDPSRSRYNYITLPALTFASKPSANTQLVSAGSISGRIQPVSGLAVWNTSYSRPLHKRSLFWILLTLPFIALVVAYQQKHFRKKLMSDSSFARSHSAFHKAKERIAEARTAVDNNQPKVCFNTLHKAISGFITDKLSLPEAGLSDAELIKKVEQNGGDQATIKLLTTLLNKCATISYAPAGGSDDQHTDIDKTEKLITDLKKILG
jgi:hypothetical protein